jgi:FtsH-binding integral membrane protein
MNEAISARPAAPARVNTFMAQVYLLMTLGLIITGFTAQAVASNKDFILRLASSPWLAFGLFIIQVLIVGVLSAAVLRMAPAAAFLLFLLYSGLTGITLSTIFLYYGQALVQEVFWYSAATFFLAALVGLITKRDLTSHGMVLFMLLLGWSIVWIFSWFFPYSSFSWAMNYIGIALFVGLAAWDSNAMKQLGARIENHPARGGLIVIGALKLYLDFINLFLLMLRAASRGR